jgi:AcrR family transcriptional regulator
MPHKDNRVDIKTTVEKKSYHHGDLRGALLEAGMAMLERAPHDELGLRKLAREVGVSATAVYRHFPDKESLLREIASQGFMMMGKMQAAAAAAAAAQGGRASFAAVGAAYVRFALKHPAVFRLMFSSAPPHDLFSLKLEDVAGPLRALRQHVAALAPAGASESDKKIISVRAWSLVHGLAVLALDRMILVDDALIDSVIAGAVKEL